MMKLNPRELEVLKILHESERPLTSTEIVNSGAELTQSTVQAVLRKLLATELVEVRGVTHSGNVLSRTFGATDKSKEILTQRFLEELKNFRTIINKVEVLSGMLEMDKDAPGIGKEVDELVKYLNAFKAKLKK